MEQQEANNNVVFASEFSQDFIDSLPLIQLTEDGGVTKKVLREGKGAKPPLEATCQVYYTGRLVPSNQIFDSVFDRTKKKDPFSVEVGTGHTIEAWDKLLLSMNIGEVALMTTIPDHAYGKLGCPPRIPGNTSVQFEVELLSFEEKKVQKVQYQNLEDRLNECTKDRMEGNNNFKNAAYRKATKSYNRALSRFNGLYNLIEEEEKKVADAKLPVYLNLAVCHLKLNEVSKAIKNAELALEIDNNNAKAYWRLGQAFMETRDFDVAKTNLYKAATLDKSSKVFFEHIPRSDSEQDIRKDYELCLKKIEEDKEIRKQNNPWKGMFL